MLGLRLGAHGDLLVSDVTTSLFSPWLCSPEIRDPVHLSVSRPSIPH